MADIDLHLFREDLAKVPPKGSDQPPRTIRAADLDGNFKKVTVLPSESDPPEYEVEYREDGTILSNFLPEGNNRGDLLYWNGSAWQVFPAASGTTLNVLTIQNGNLAWTPTQDCP
jgi:hypothetical protein